MQSVSEIVHAFGGPTEFGRLFEVPYQTVQTWQRRGYLPADRDVRFVEEAKKLKISLSYEHLAKIRHAGK